MKKTAKSILIVMFIATMVFALTGCGSKKDKKEENKDTLVATKTESDTYFGEYKQIVEVTFKEDKADTVVMTMEFDKEDTAKGIASIFALAQNEDMQGIETRQEGTKFIMTMNAATYAQQENIDADKLTRDALKQSFTENGFEVK